MMSLESRELLIDDFKTYSEGLVIALKQDKLVEARGYVSSLTTCLETISSYLNSQITLLEESHVGDLANPLDIARSEAEIAVFAVKRADEKARHLEQAVRETRAESKRLKKALSHAKRDAKRARAAANKAEKAEGKAAKESAKAAEQASKANQAARRS